MQYLIVEASSSKEMAKGLPALLKEGWKPQGGICVYANRNGILVFCQAMVKDE